MYKKMAAILIAYMLSGIYFVPADQQAVVRRLGRVVAERVPPGLHYRWPYPIERINKLKVYESKRVTVGMREPDRVLGRQAGAERSFLTGDQNIINVQMTVQYTIKKPAAYLFRSRSVADLIAKASEAALTSVVSSQLVDSLLTTGKVEAQNAIRVDLQAALDYYGVGVAINSVNIESVTPPEEVADAFREVASAREDRNRIINEAHGYANAVIPKARGEAVRILQEAYSYRQRKINEAQGDAARFSKLAEEYRKAAEVTSTRLYIEAMEDILPRLKKIVVDSNGSQDAIDLLMIREQQ